MVRRGGREREKRGNEPREVLPTAPSPMTMILKVEGKGGCLE